MPSSNRWRTSRGSPCRTPTSTTTAWSTPTTVGAMTRRARTRCRRTCGPGDCPERRRSALPSMRKAGFGSRPTVRSSRRRAGRCLARSRVALGMHVAPDNRKGHADALEVVPPDHGRNARAARSARSAATTSRACSRPAASDGHSPAVSLQRGSRFRGPSSCCGSVGAKNSSPSRPPRASKFQAATLYPPPPSTGQLVAQRPARSCWPMCSKASSSAGNECVDLAVFVSNGGVLGMFLFLMARYVMDSRTHLEACGHEMNRPGIRGGCLV